MPKLVIGFDSAWTPNNWGALVGAVQHDDGRWKELGPPIQADFVAAERQILEWQNSESPSTTLVLLDQPTIVPNRTGQRAVENIVASPVSARYGGVQPANTGRTAMFGRDAPVWRFLDRFGGAADIGAPMSGAHVLETYPVLTMIALGWTLADSRPRGRLPKYNPARSRTFSISDWRHVCTEVATSMGGAGLSELSASLIHLGNLDAPKKQDQDALDACICLLVGLNAALGHECLWVGELQTGYIVIPYGAELEAELIARCEATGRDPAHWLQRFRLFKPGLLGV